MPGSAARLGLRGLPGKAMSIFESARVAVEPAAFEGGRCGCEILRDFEMAQRAPVAAAVEVLVAIAVLARRAALRLW